MSSSGWINAACLAAGRPAEQLLACSRNRIGSENRTPRRLDFKTGPKASALLLQVRGRKSEKLDNLIRGKVWIDDVTIEQADRS